MAKKTYYSWKDLDTDKGAIKRRRTVEQCALIASANKIAFNSRTVTAPGDLYIHNTVSTKYHHMALMDGISIEEIIGKYFVGPETEILFNLKPYELSSLVPKIGLYRVDMYKGKIKPDGIKEFFFSDHTDKDHVKQMLAGRTDRFGEAGIQSVTWSLLGGQPAEVKRYIQVNIKILFSSIEVLTKGPTESGAPKYLDLFARISKDPKNKQLYPKTGYYRLRLDVGWSIPDKLSSPLFKNNPSRRQKIIDALEKTNKTLWLHLKNHDLNFNQDGSVELTINYLSSLEHELQRVSVISELREVGSGTTKMTAAESKKRIASTKQVYNKWKACADKELAKGRWRAGGWGITKHTKKSIKILQGLFDKAQARNMTHGLEILENITRLLGKDSVRIVPTTSGNLTFHGKSLKALVVPDTLLGYDRGILGDGLQKEKKFNEAINSITRRDIYQVPSSFNLARDIAGLRTKVRTGATKGSKDLKKEILKIVQKYSTTTKIASSSGGVSKSFINYVLFGDLLDAVLQTCKELYKNDPNMQSFFINTRIILGSVKIPAGPTGGREYVDLPISHLPISMNLFTAWFVKNVIDKGKSFFLLKDFIRKMITELILSSTGSTCFEKTTDLVSFPQSTTSIGFHTIRTNIDNEGIFINKDTPLFRINNGKFLKKPLPTHFSEPSINDSDSMKNYLLIYARNPGITHRKKDREKDHLNGIFHLNIGSPVGIVKEITFSKSDSKYLEESLLTVKPTDMSLEVFRRIYNVSISFFGNAAFFPGQHIFVDPSTVGMGDPSILPVEEYSAARLLGLGGYYLITKVDSEISPGKFETKIEARWVGFGDGKKKNTKLKKILKNPCKTYRHTLITYWVIHLQLHDAGIDVGYTSRQIKNNIRRARAWAGTI